MKKEEVDVLVEDKVRNGMAWEEAYKEVKRDNDYIKETKKRIREKRKLLEKEEKQLDKKRSELQQKFVEGLRKEAKKQVAENKEVSERVSRSPNLTQLKRLILIKKAEPSITCNEVKEILKLSKSQYDECHKFMEKYCK